MIYAAPGAAGAKITYKAQYNNFIGGKWVAPVKGQYFDVVTPISGKVYTQAARSTAEDVELALDAGTRSRPDAWGKTPAAQRANVLLKIADRLEANLELTRLCRDRRQRQGHPRNPERRHSARPSTTSATSPAACVRRKARMSRNRRKHRRSPHPRAARRRRPDHPVELPDPDGRLETGPGHRRRQLRRPQAG
jgi:hypothetical protein